MKRESFDKTRFCVSHDGLCNGLETFTLPCFMFKKKHIFLTEEAPLYWSLGSNILEPLGSKNKFFVLFLNMKHGKQKVSSPLLRPSCDTQNLVLSELSLFIPSQNLENKI